MFLPQGVVLIDRYASATATGTSATGATRQTRYYQKDRLGSTTVVTNEAGAVLERQYYDPWGKRRNGNGSDADTLRSLDHRMGYTDQEHLDAVGLIHFNGRIYDPTLARFMSADPTVPDPSDGQNFNRYTYVLNNPTVYTDPSGFSQVRQAEFSTGLGIGSSTTASETSARFGFSDDSISSCHTLDFGCRASRSGQGCGMDPSAGCLVSLGASYAADLSRAMAGSMASIADNNANRVVDDVIDGISLSTVAASLGFSARGAYAGKGLLMAGGDAASAFQALARAEAEAAVTSFKQCKTMDCVGVAHQRMIEARDSYRAAGNLPYDSDGNALNANIMQAAGLLRQVNGAMQAGGAVAVGTLGGGAAKRATSLRNSHLAGSAHPKTGVPFDKAGYPDFSGVAKAEVKITQTQSRAGDFRAANEAAGFKNTPEGYTWHHHQDGRTMQLVPRDIHSRTGHTGGFKSGP
jgi:RHS repeat-associated protein